MKHYINQTLVVLLIAYCSALLLQACNSVCSCKQVACPAYSNPNFDQWFPYQTAQQLVLIDTAQAANTDTFIITKVLPTSSYQANKGCINSDAGCSSEKDIEAIGFYVMYHSMNDWDGNPVDSSYWLTVHDFSITAKGLGNEGFVNTDLPSQFYHSIRLGGRDYQDVQLIWKADTSGVKDYIYQVYIQKNTGLLAYRYYPSQSLFIKQ